MSLDSEHCGCCIRPAAHCECPSGEVPKGAFKEAYEKVLKKFHKTFQALAKGPTDVDWYRCDTCSTERFIPYDAAPPKHCMWNDCGGKQEWIPKVPNDPL